MRVGLITREYPPNVYGGAGVHVEYLSRELAKKIEVEVHCWGNQREDAGALHVRGLELPSGSSGDSHQKFKGAVDAFAINLAQLRELDAIELVHTHTWYASMAGFLAKKLYNIPSVLTTHSLEPLRAWKADQLGTGYALSSWMERTAVLDADAIIAVSNGTKADIIKAYPEVDQERIHVIYNGIDLDEYRYTEDITALKKYGVDPARPYVLFVGRITRQKGVTHLVDAIPYMPPGTQVVLCAGAPDTPEIAAEMRQKIADVRRAAGGSVAVVWIEQMVTKREAIQLYSHCAVFCCPSVYEPFGIINLEAMACNAPVVASATGGIMEVVVEGKTGHLVAFDPDPKTTLPAEPATFARALAVQITDLLNDRAKAKRYGEAGRKRAEEKFAWSAIADQTIELYRELLINERRTAKK
ncbi:MAG: glycosyltransferase family 4 protein [Pseudomonadota bacterium]|nr:glycosyltransferase family 4 protein [Pseudomonadota bacterium]